MRLWCPLALLVQRIVPTTYALFVPLSVIELSVEGTDTLSSAGLVMGHGGND